MIELGCGPGQPVTRALAERHTIVGVDISAAQSRLAREAAPGAAFLLADMTEVASRPPAPTPSSPSTPWATSRRPPTGRLLAGIARWLRPGGLLLASAPVGAAGGVQDWLGVPMYFGGIGRAATVQALTSTGMSVEAAEIVDEDEGDAIVQFLWITATKPAAVAGTGQ